MNSTLNFSISEASIYAMDLNKIIFSGLEIDDTLVLKIEIADNSNFTNSDVLDNTYYADADGKIKIYDLGQLWNAHVLAWVPESEGVNASLKRRVYVRFTYTLGDTTASCTRTIIYSRRYINKTPAEVAQFFPVLNRKKKTFFDSDEPLFAVNSSNTLNVGVAYIADSLTKWQEIALSPSATGEIYDYYDLSPATVLNLLNTAISGSLTATSLLYYDVYLLDAGGNELDDVRYDLQAINYPQRTELTFLNLLGVYETVPFLGLATNEPDRSAEYGYLGSDYGTVDLEVNDIYTLNSGYCNKKVMAQVRDMLESPFVYLHKEDEWHKITIIDSSYKLDMPTNEAFNVSIKFRYADEIDNMSTDITPWSAVDVFSKPPFDKSFE